MSKSTPRSRAWCYTLNNYSDDEYAELQATECKHHVIGKEVGTEGTPHLQGHVYFENKKSLAQVKKLQPRAHWEQTRNILEAVNYCEKDGDIWEQGERPKDPKKQGQAEKRRWDEALAAAKEGRVDDIPSDIQLRYYGTIKRIRMDHAPKLPALDELQNEWRYGPTGTGKSRDTRTQYPDAYIKAADTHWWNGYRGEDVVIIEDFDKYHVKVGFHLKIWLDHYDFPAETKGGEMRIRPKKIIITSNYHPAEIWDDDKTVQPILRRVKLVEYGKEEERKPWHNSYNKP